MKQLSFSSFEERTVKKETKKSRFLNEMDQVLPWKALCDVIEPYYPKAGNGRRPYPLKSILKIHLMQQWYNLSDPGMEEALYDCRAMRTFSELGSLSEPTPDESTIMNFRHLLERHKLADALFKVMNKYLASKGLKVESGTIVDATIIHAPSSTKNDDKQRDPEMHSTVKGNQFYFGAKLHIGVDRSTGIVHSVVCTSANVHDLNVATQLLHGNEACVFGDAGYQGLETRIENSNIFEENNQPMSLISMRKGKRKALDKNTVCGSIQHKCEVYKSGVRAKVEHVFRVIKRQFKFEKTRYRGLYKLTSKLAILCGLVNIYKHRKLLLE